MKIIKPLSQSLLYKVFEREKKCFLCVSAISGFVFDSYIPLMTETDLWKMVNKELGKDAVLDMCMPKTNAEAIVIGKCHAPSGAANAGRVSLNLGSIDKTLYIFGNRYWKQAGQKTESITAPEVFSEMDMAWENAFGGEAHGQNPLGKGAEKVVDNNGQTVHPLPNIEWPDRLITSSEDLPEPACFCPIDQMWPQRLSKAGTYDRQWMDELFPGLARDIDMTYFNVAPQDQWIDGFFKGDEPFDIKGMHPEKALVSGFLPHIRARCFINCKTGTGENFKELAGRTDTVWFFPHIESGILVWRAVTEIHTDDASDILHMMVAYERLSDEPRPFEHYRDAFLKRIDEDTGYVYLMDEKDLIPADEPSGLAALMKDAAGKKSTLADNMERKALNEKQKAETLKAQAMERAKQTLGKYGIDPDTILAAAADREPAVPMPDPPRLPDIDPDHMDPDSLVKFIEASQEHAEKQEAAAEKLAEKSKAAAEKKLKEICDKKGMDFEQTLADMKKAARPKRPVFDAQKTLDDMRKTRQRAEAQIQDICRRMGVDYETVLADAQSRQGKQSFPLIETFERVRQLDPDDPALVEKLNEARNASLEAYRMTAHNQDKPPALPSEAALALRDQFVAAKEQGHPFAEKDFMGADLSGLDLRGMDLKGVFMEGANLTGADLTETDLSGAVLAWANLTDAVADRAKLKNTTLGGAILKNTRMKDADMTGAVLCNAEIRESDLSGALMGEVNFADAGITHTDLSGARITDAVLMEPDFTGNRFCDAHLDGSILIKPKLGDTDFSGASCPGVIFVGPLAKGAVFKSSDLFNARFIKQADLRAADFSGANLDEANLMEADVSNADFKGASMNKANLMMAKARQADMTGAVIRQANCIKADFQEARLTGANLMETNLKGVRAVLANFEQASLYGAEVFRMTVGETHFDDADLTMTKLKDEGSDEQG